MQVESLNFHSEFNGKISVNPTHEFKNHEDLKMVYTPGMAYAVEEIARDPELSFKYTWRSKSVAILCDGTAVLGYGNIGPEAGLPVMEGKSVIFQHFAGLSAIPMCVRTNSAQEVITLAKQIEPSFGAIQLEDIKAPECFEIERKLKKELSIPVFHDDQHGTAVVTLAGLINSLKIVSKTKEDVKVVINGAGAAGLATAKLLFDYGFKNIILLDSRGILSSTREDLNKYKIEALEYSNPEDISGDLDLALQNADVFIGVSVRDLLTQKHIESMNSQPIIFALANPVPEIMPEKALEYGAAIIATGRADYPNQVNNVLAFPGIVKGAMDSGSQINNQLLINAAVGLSKCVKNLTPEKIIPGAFDEGVFDSVYNEIVG